METIFTYYIKVVIKILCDRGLENKNILFSQISFHIKGQEHFKLYFSINWTYNISIIIKWQ